MTTETNPLRDIAAIQVAARRLFAQHGDAVTLTDIAVNVPISTALNKVVGQRASVVDGGRDLDTVRWRPAGVSPLRIALSLGAALATGIFLGVSPARRAAPLKPIDALRME